MSQDNNDDPFAPPKDATIFRPRPGAGKRGADRPASPEPPRSSAEPPPPSAAAAAPPGRAPLMAALGDFTGRGLNPLVQAASPLLMLMGRLRTSLTQPDIGGL